MERSENLYLYQLESSELTKYGKAIWAKSILKENSRNMRVAQGEQQRKIANLGLPLFIFIIPGIVPGLGSETMWITMWVLSTLIFLLITFLGGRYDSLRAYHSQYGGEKSEGECGRKVGFFGLLGVDYGAKSFLEVDIRDSLMAEAGSPMQSEKREIYRRANQEAREIILIAESQAIEDHEIKKLEEKFGIMTHEEIIETIEFREEYVNRRGIVQSGMVKSQPP